MYVDSALVFHFKDALGCHVKNSGGWTVLPSLYFPLALCRDVPNSHMVASLLPITDPRSFLLASQPGQHQHEVTVLV